MNNVVPMRRRDARTEYVLFADGRRSDVGIAGGYVSACITARLEALAHPGVRYEVDFGGEVIAEYVAMDGQIVEVWVA